MNIIEKRYNRISKVYDFLESPMEMKMGPCRKELIRKAHGKILEIGVGTGKNLSLYAEDTDVTGIDFSEKMLERAKRKVSSERNIKLIHMDAQNLEFEDNSFDTVITSCVFCSVPDPVKGLKEIRRVCKKNGKVLMLEHVRSENRVLGRLMDILNPIPLNIYGANINRNTFANMIKAGFSEEEIGMKYLFYDILIEFEIIKMKDQ